MAVIKLYFDKRKQKQDGKYPLKLRVCHKRSARFINTIFSFSEKEWNETDQIPTRHCENFSQINGKIRKMLSDASNVIADYQDDLRSLSVEELKELVETALFGESKERVKVKKKSALFLFEYTEDIIKQLRQANKIGNANVYNTALSSLKRFLKDRDVEMSAVDLKFIKSYETYCLSNGLRRNGINVYMRTLRAVINRAIDEGYLSQEHYPFRKYSVRPQQTAKRAISKDELSNVFELDIEPNSHLWNSKNYFTFMFHMRGMNFIDVAYLKKENLQNDRISYHRKKTGKLYNIKLTDEANRILNIYIKGKKLKPKDLLFPIMPEEVMGNAELEFERYRNRRKYLNKDLKELGKLAELDAPLTSYVSRHTWASIAKFSGVAPALIGESLGHSDLKTTETYLANFAHEALDAVNEIVVG